MQANSTVLGQPFHDDADDRPVIFLASEQVCRFAVDGLMYLHKLQVSNVPDGPDRDFHLRCFHDLSQQHRVLHQSIVKEELAKLRAQCDICFRSSISQDQRVLKHRYLLQEAMQCNVSVDRWFHNRNDNLFDFESVCESVLSNQALFVLYGKRDNFDESCNCIRTQFNDAWVVARQLLSLVIKFGLFQVQPPSFGPPGLLKDSLRLLPTTASSGIRTFVSNVDAKVPPQVKPELDKHIHDYYTKINLAEQALETLTTRVRHHVKKRTERNCIYLSHAFLGEDIVFYIAQLTGFHTACRLLFVDKTFRDDANIRTLLPHIRIRHIQDGFPHSMQNVPNVGSCAAVSKHNQVCLAVDLVVSVPECLVKKTPSTSSACNIQTRSSLITLCPRHARAEQEMARMRSQMDSDMKKKDEREKKLRSVPEEPEKPGKRIWRMSPLYLFGSELECRIDLVFADSHELVTPEYPDSALSVPRKMLAWSSRLTTYTSSEGVPYPALTRCNVTPLLHTRTTPSKRFSDSEFFKFKVVAVGFNTRPNGATEEVKFVSFSEPFVLISSKRAFKRSRSQCG